MRFATLGLLLSIVPARAETSCATCHADIAKSYRVTGMGRSFSLPGAQLTREPYYHPPSDTYFEMIQRGGQFFQRQYQLGYQGKQTNISETQVDYVLGSGNHARTYLHRAAGGRLIELPLGWYAEQGGTFAMNPGFDRADHAGLSRAIPYACMFCHNAYPEAPTGRSPRADAVFGKVPAGIDCQRCHGDGREHMRLASEGAGDLRKAIVNPARLPLERQMEVCLQCHLESNSWSSAGVIPLYEREPFSFKPGERLADFLLQFDQTPARDRFQIVGSSAYRLRQSQCFLKSKGALTCITCHDPHQVEADYSKACLKCHAVRHTASNDCVACHMPKRRTQDAVHVAMTDHLIQRNPARDLLAPIKEVSQGDNGGTVVPYYPGSPTHASDELYLGVAQVNVPTTRPAGIATLAAAIEKFHPAAAEYYLQLGDALRASRRYWESIAPYEEAVRREPQSAIAHQRLALGLVRVQRNKEAEKHFQQAIALAPRDAGILKELGVACLEQGRMAEASAALEKSLALDPQQPVALNALGGARMKTGDPAGAEASFREAIRQRPHYASAHHNMAFLLAESNRFEEAQYHFKEALRLEDSAATRLDYAAMLDRIHRLDDALEQYREAVRLAPESARANRALGTALDNRGETAAAAPYLKKAGKLEKPQQ
jgi:Flp pilus assembly protein TadD